jgi:hypothetical protein
MLTWAIQWWYVMYVWCPVSREGLALQFGRISPWGFLRDSRDSHLLLLWYVCTFFFLYWNLYILHGGFYDSRWVVSTTHTTWISKKKTPLMVCCRTWQFKNIGTSPTRRSNGLSWRKKGQWWSRSQSLHCMQEWVIIVSYWVLRNSRAFLFRSLKGSSTIHTKEPVHNSY